MRAVSLWEQRRGEDGEIVRRIVFENPFAAGGTRTEPRICIMNLFVALSYSLSFICGSLVRYIGCNSERPLLAPIRLASRGTE